MTEENGGAGALIDNALSAAGGTATDAIVASRVRDAALSSLDQATRAKVGDYLASIGQGNGTIAEVDELLSNSNINQFKPTAVQRATEQAATAGKLSGVGASSVLTSVIAVADLETAFEEDDPKQAAISLFGAAGGIVGGIGGAAFVSVVRIFGPVGCLI